MHLFILYVRVIPIIALFLGLKMENKCFTDHEYYCNSITPILDNWSIAQVSEAHPIIVFQERNGNRIFTEQHFA